MPGRVGLPRPLRVIAHRLAKLVRRAKYRIKSRAHKVTPRHSYTRYIRTRDNARKKARKKRRARLRNLRARVYRQAFGLPIDPIKKNERIFRHFWMGNQDNAEILKRQKITRVFHLDRKTVVLQPHVDEPNRPPQLTFYEAYDYNETNLLKDFEDLCRIICVEAFLGNNVLIYRAANATREEYSRGRTLLIAYRIYIRADCMKCIHKQVNKPFEGLRKDDLEQLMVWDAMIKAEDEANRALIYQGWEEDKERNLKWREHGVRKGPICTVNKDTHCVVM